MIWDFLNFLKYELTNFWDIFSLAITCLEKGVHPNRINLFQEISHISNLPLTLIKYKTTFNKKIVTSVKNETFISP